ncbi:hypothetical protein ACM26V_24290 [Salipaludibacillus sp. HK11]|uniref:hypothetical protein n=1 Tax=Salipaludibacillus sp. HK11 TaxID=3394320 RepID=UPI0039FD535E
MDERKRIIVSEIKKWQENKLLPETYCLFLLSLYSEGNDGMSETTSKKTDSLIPHAKKALLSFFIMIIVMVIILLAIYFTQTTSTVQVVILVGLLGLSIAGAYFYHQKKSLYAHLYVVLATFISFIITIVAMELFFPDNRIFLGGGILVLCLGWILAGWRYRYHYLYIAGGTGILLFIGLIIVERM